MSHNMPTPPSPNSPKTLFDFIKAFLLPTLIGKVLILYFGIHYSKYPDEGYGIGLVLSILFTLGGLTFLIWKYRNYEDI